MTEQETLLLNLLTTTKNKQKMRKTKLFKSLLVMAGMLVGGNVWAADTSGKTVVGTTVTETYDFNGWGLANLNSKSTATIAKASETADHTVGETAVYEITNPVGNASATLELYNRFAMSNPGTDRGSYQVLFYNSDKSGNRATLGGTANIAGIISILDLPKDATVTITYDGTFTFKSANVNNSSDVAVSVNDAVVSNETYTVKSAGDLDLYHETWSGIRKVVIVYEATEEVVTAPTLVLTGTNGNNRIITVTDGTSSDGEATLTTYYTTNGDIPTSSSTAVVGGEITVSTSCTIKAITISSAGGESPVTELAVEAGTPIVLDSPVINRTANTTVSISAPQSILGNPTATIYYRIGDSGDFSAYSEALTVSSHTTVYAYATASGYGNSATISREIAFVSSFPQSSILNKVSYTTGGIDTENPTDGGTITTYYPIKADGNQWGHNIYFQNAGWNIRGDNTWVNQGASSANSWMLIKDLKEGDIVVVRMNEGALATVNATYLEKYSYNGHYAYVANTDGNIELRFQRKADKGNNVLAGIDQYPNTTFTLSANEAQHLTFHNAGSGSANDQNWMMNVYNGGNKVGEVRADWWDNVAGGNANFTSPYNYSADGGITTGPNVWANYLTDMTDADVDFTVSYTGGALYIIGTMTKDDDIYYVNYTKTGLSDDVSIYLYGNNATLSNIDYSTTDINTTPAGPSGIIGTTIGTTGWSTFASPYALDLSSLTASTGTVKAYYASAVASNKVTMTSTEQAIAAGEGIMLKGTAGATITITVAASGTAISGNLLRGCTTGTVIGKDSESGFNNYVLVSESGKAKFQSLVDNGATIPAGKAYLQNGEYTDGGGGNARLSIVFEDEAAGIDAMQMDSEDGMEDSVHNLNGQRVSLPSKGLYIVNGRKVVVK